jgi:putative DNA methylase
MATKAPKKLIEVALPLDDINAAAAREKSIRHGHPSTLHLWWARRPLAAARAVLFAQMVNDPGGERGWGRYKGQTKEDAQREREELFAILRELVKWENTNNEAVLERARAAIRKSWRETCELNKGQPGFDPDKLPAFHDPFAGGGAIPLEAQRLGLEAYASDLNPVAVLINKAMIEIPPRFAGRPPVHPDGPGDGKSGKTKKLFKHDWKGAEGLAEDVRYYGQWMRDEAFKRIGHLYPPVEVTAEMAKDRPDLKQYVGKKLTVIAWIWARTVKSPNPAYSHVDVPLASTFMLSTKKGKEAYVEPVIEGDGYRFTVKVGKPKDAEAAKNGTKLSRGANFQCFMSGGPIESEYIRSEARAARMGTRLIAVIADGHRGRVFLPPTREQEAAATEGKPDWKPEAGFVEDARAFTPCIYGINQWYQLFTDRQLVALTTFADLLVEVRERIRQDSLTGGMADDGKPLRDKGAKATAYAEAAAVYLAFALDKVADRGSTLGRWDPTPTQSGIINTFSRQALPMTWDYGESNPLGAASGNYVNGSLLVAKALLASSSQTGSVAHQNDAATQTTGAGKLVSTDPPYYDNIGYADLSDFFYAWLRRSLRGVFPDLFAALAVPKAEELIATPYRHGTKEKAETFFLDGMTEVMSRLAQQAHAAFPVTIYYAFKQSESKSNSGTASTGWETFLDAVIRAGFGITGTWPMRTELGNRMIGAGANALASSIVLVCRKRDPDAPAVSRKQFLRQLEEELPEALEAMIGGREGTTAVAPVDLAQAAIGPGMAVYSRYSAVLEADGSPMPVRTALTIINKAIDEYFSHAESDMDADTRFCVDGVRDSGAVQSGGGKVRLLAVKEFPADWDPRIDARVPVWEACHQMARALAESESSAGALLARMPEKTEPIRQLAYRLYTVCERKGWAEEARTYNELVTSWHAIVEASHHAGRKGEQLGLEI